MGKKIHNKQVLKRFVPYITYGDSTDLTKYEVSKIEKFISKFINKKTYGLDISIVGNVFYGKCDITNTFDWVIDIEIES